MPKKLWALVWVRDKVSGFLPVTATGFTLSTSAASYTNQLHILCCFCHLPEMPAQKQPYLAYCTVYNAYHHYFLSTQILSRNDLLLKTLLSMTCLVMMMVAKQCTIG